MADAKKLQGQKTTIVGAGVLLALVAGALTAPAQAAPVTGAVQAVDCPAAVPIDSVTAGMTGQGLTVVSGSTPEPFNVEVLGVLTDGVGAGRDIIMVKVSDVAGGHVIDQGGGIWAGMSGSPVYVNGQLLGAVAFDFTDAPSTIGGLTPAEDMLDILDLSTTAAAKPKPAVRKNATVKVSSSTRRDLAAKAGTAAPRGSLRHMVKPLAVSGLSSVRLGQLQAEADAAGLSVKAYAAGRAKAPTADVAPAARPQVGGNFAGVLSYGDLTVGAIGTTTVVCGNHALAFGHPFNLSGPATYGANDAQALAIVKDDTSGSFKMANIGTDFGTVDQDRTAGIRADLRAVPTTANVTTTISNLDSGKSRVGTTRFADRSSLPGLLPFAVLNNYDSVYDEIGDGTAKSRWTISGHRAGNVAFTISRSNLWASRDDVAVEPAFDVALAADAIYNNDFEEVSIDNVTFDSGVATKFQQLHITKMEVSVNGGAYTSAQRLTVSVGAKLRIRVSMRPYRGTATTTTSTLDLTVPGSARGQSGSLDALGGIELGQEEDLDLGCLLAGICGEEDGPGSLNAVFADIRSAPKNNAVVAQLTLESEDPGNFDESPAPAASATKHKKLTVAGGRSIEVQVRR